jgi:hypothetical protein
VFRTFAGGERLSGQDGADARSSPSRFSMERIVQRAEVSALPNVRVNRPAEASTVSLVRDDAPCAADQAYGACRSGSG